MCQNLFFSFETSTLFYCLRQSIRQTFPRQIISVRRSYCNDFCNIRLLRNKLFSLESVFKRLILSKVLDESHRWETYLEELRTLSLESKPPSVFSSTITFLLVSQTQHTFLCFRPAICISSKSGSRFPLIFSGLSAFRHVFALVAPAFPAFHGQHSRPFQFLWPTTCLIEKKNTKEPHFHFKGNMNLYIYKRQQVSIKKRIKFVSILK